MGSSDVMEFNTDDLLDNSDESKNVIINELLCFTHNNFNAYPHTGLKATLLKFYTDTEVTTAKQLFFNVSIASLLTSESASRKGIHKKEREIEDILALFRLADAKKFRIPQYVAYNLARIPTVIKEEECMTSIVMRLRKLEDEMQSTQILSQQNNNDISVLKRNVPQNIPRPPPPPSKVPIPSYSTAVSSSRNPLAKLMQPTEASRRSFRTNRLVSLTSNTSNTSKRMRPNSESEYTVVPTRQKRRNGARGTRTSCPISGGPNNFDVFMYHVTKDTNTDVVKEWLESENIKVHNIEKVSHTLARFDSFKINVDREHYHTLCGSKAAEFLPQNIQCKPYMKPRPRDENQNNVNPTSRD